MSAGYYEDLSPASTESEDESDEELDDEYRGIDDDDDIIGKDDDRCILHVDVDCFYCQCEMIDRKIPEDKPFAIGQKHIIVTCNYEARKYGVKKLELREKAYAKCPRLVILEGSDLERYRIHARKVYQSFRSACKRINSKVPVSKGAMDEMTVDLSLACQGSNAPLTLPPMDNVAVYVYGEQQQGKESVTLTEDQTGDSVVIFRQPTMNQVGHEQTQYRNKVQYSLRQAAHFAIQIQQAIFQETGFTVTCGLSVNPLLSKWAGDLRKPNSINVLYPWVAAHLVASMPLRKIPGAGRSTLKALHPCLECCHPHRKQPIIWTCRDLLQVPESDVIVSLDKLSSTGKSGREQCRILRQKCRGQDTSAIVDDHGGLPKTVSVENSFKRGSVLTKEAVCQAMEDLYDRLPRLVLERAAWSTATSPTPADYPTTIRLTVRVVVKDPSRRLPGRRPFVTHSKQAGFDGKTFTGLNEKSGAACLRRSVMPLLQDLVFTSTDIDVTRINIAVTNFEPATSFAWNGFGRAAAKPSPKTTTTTLRDGSSSKSSAVHRKTSALTKSPAAKRQRIDQYFALKTSK